MTRRVLRTEIRRGPAPVVAILTGGAGLLIVLGEPFGARWMSFASAVQYSLFLVAPLVIAVAVWHGGREHRRKTGELTRAASRPGSAPVLVRWAALTIGTTAGLLVVIGLGVVRVAPRASYWGGGWWWLLAAAVVGLAAVTAVGMVVGHFLPYRALAPLVAIGTYAVLLFMLDGLPRRVAEVSDEATTMFHRVAALVPLQGTNDLDWQLVTTHNGLSMLAWLAALVVASLAAMAARRVVVRVAIWLLPLAAAWYLGYHGNNVAMDHAALEPVCAGEPSVCVTRVNAYGLPAAAAAADQAFDRWAGIEGAPTVATDSMLQRFGTGDAPTIDLHEFDDVWTASFYLWPSCQTSPDTDRAATVAMMWSDPRVGVSGPGADVMFDELTSWDDADQRAWMGRYLAAAGACDDDRLVALAEALT